MRLDATELRLVNSGGNVHQPNHFSAHSIAGDQVERRPRAGEEWIGTTQHDGVHVESILIDKTKVGQSARQHWAANFEISGESRLEFTERCFTVALKKLSVRADGLLLLVSTAMQKTSQIFAEAAEGVEAVRSGFEDFRFGLEDLLAVALDQQAHDFPHAPAGGADHFQAVRSCAQERDAAVAEDSDTVRVTLEGLQLKSF